MPNNDRIFELINQNRVNLDELELLLNNLLITKITPVDDLQAALDKGGNIQIDGKFTGSYIVRTSGTHLFGLNIDASIISNIKAEAIVIPPRVSDIKISNLILGSTYYAVLRAGENSINQTKIEDCPSNIILENIRIPTHRNRRGFEIHAKDVLIDSCSITDVYDPSGSDSQAIYLGNTPGNILIKGSDFSAGSEVFLSGGDSYKIPNVTPNKITINDCSFYRPLSWRTDGIKRKVKNLFEVKNGTSFFISECYFDGSWKDGQTGECFVLTPAIDGAITSPPKQSGTVRDINISDCVVKNVSTVFSILGRHYTSFTPDALTLNVDGLQFECDNVANGGRGIFALIGGEPDSIKLNRVVGTFNGTSFIYYYGGDVLDPITKLKRPAGKLGELVIKDNTVALPLYGINLMGAELGANWNSFVGAAIIEGNNFSRNVAKLKNLFPNNNYV